VSGKSEAEPCRKIETLRGGDELILDDEETVRSMTKDILEDHGYCVYPAENGIETVEAYTAHRNKIDLVPLVDMIMPKMGGSETFQKQKKLNPTVKSILSNGYSQHGRAQETLNNGARGFAQNPFEADELLLKIRNVIDPAGPDDEGAAVPAIRED